MCAAVKQIELPADRRVFAVSDIHGNLDYLKGLLDQISFSEQDVLILLGDLVEKGPRSLDTLQYIISLSKRYTVHTVCGNCDRILFCIDEDWLFAIRNHWKGHLLINEFARKMHRSLDCVEDVAKLRGRIQAEYPEECAFLQQLPIILVSEHYLFVHGGVPGEESLNRLDTLDDWACMKNDDFMEQGHKFSSKWCVVGHWPTTLYRRYIPCSNPLVSVPQQIISIDGGCSVKRDGQLNAVLLPAEPDGHFPWSAYDALPTAQALDAQSPPQQWKNIRYGDNAVKLIERGEEFSTCLHVSSGQTIDILNEDIWVSKRGVFCEDTTNYALPIKPGDRLSIIQQTSRGNLVKKDGVTGWYTGRLKWGETVCEKV